MSCSGTSASGRRGAYGLTLPDLPGQQWLNPAPHSWPTWRFQYTSEVDHDDSAWIGAQQAKLQLKPSGAVHIDGRSGLSTVQIGAAPPEAAYVHPILGSTAIMVAEWSGRLVFHGGCVLDRHGRAWALLGEREAGKSTALSWFHLNGRVVFADDLIVTDGTEVFVGPRCIDLRERSHDHFGLGRDIGMVGTRRRWRLDLSETVPSAPLGGVVVLDWGKSTSVDVAGISDKADLLRAHRGLIVGQHHRLPWLELLGTPVLKFRRQRSWASLDEAMTVISERMDAVPLRSDSTLKPMT